MKQSWSIERIRRALQLILALHGNPYLNARELAAICEVSRRTVHRDRQILESAGIPVQYDPERQGYHLPMRFTFPHQALEEEELRALVLLCQAGRSGDGLELCRDAQRAISKLITSLRPESRARFLALIERVCVRRQPINFSSDRSAVYIGIIDSLIGGFQIRLSYRDRQTRVLQSSKVAPYRLLIDGSSWYLIGRSSLHRSVKVFFLPWVGRVERTDDRAKIPARFDIEKFLGHAWAVERGRRAEVQLSFSTSAAPIVREQQWHPSQRIVDRDDEGLDLYLSLDGCEEVLGWILGFGDEVEVIAPVELRALVRSVCRRMAERHDEAQPPKTEKPQTS